MGWTNVNYNRRHPGHSTRIGKIPLHIPQKMARPSRGDKYLGRGRMDNVGLPSPTIIVMAH